MPPLILFFQRIQTKTGDILWQEKTRCYAKVTYRDGGVYEGSVENGLPSSCGCTGKYIYPNGDYYIGGFKNGRFDYQGIIYDRTGKVICDAYWKEGEIAKLYKGELPENCRTGV